MAKHALENIDLADAMEIDRLCDGFEATWRAGTEPDLVEFLFQGKRINFDILLRELIRIDYAHRLDRGELVDLQWYIDFLPGFTSEIESAFRSLAESTRTSAQFSDLASLSSLDAEQAAFIGRQFGQYRITGLLGQGGMGTVYKAEHTLISRTVAIKISRPKLATQPQAIERFKREAQVSLALKHTNVVDVYDINIDPADGTIYMIMELIDGPNLSDLVRTKGPLSCQEAARIVHDIASALSFASHQKQPLVHRDIKPQNIMMTQGGRVLLLDLGLAGFIEDESLATSAIPDDLPVDVQATQAAARLTDGLTVFGTPAYMAPEQILDPRKADIRSDIFSLGCTFRFLWTGQNFHEGLSVREVLDATLRGVRPPLQEILADRYDAQFDQLIQKMTALAPQDRHQTPEELIAELNQLLGIDPLATTIDVRRMSIDDLRDLLISRKLVSQEDWVRLVEWATTSLRSESTTYLGSRSWEDAGRTSRAFPQPKIDDPVNALLRLQSPRGGALSEFQVQAILAGQIERLLLGNRILTNQLGRSWKGELFLARNPDEKARQEVVRTFGLPILEGLVGDLEERTKQFYEISRRYQSVEHPNLIKFYEAGLIAQDVGYWASEFVSTQNLASNSGIMSMLRSGKLEPDEVVKVVIRWFSRITDALAALHGAGLPHLDVSLWTIHVDSSNARLLGAGLRRLVASSEGRSAVNSNGVTIGSIGTMAPELWLQPYDVGPPADLFSLGAAMYYTLVGHFPYFPTPPEELAETQLIERVREMSHLHESISIEPLGWLGPLIIRLLDPNLLKRPSIHEVQRELAELSQLHFAPPKPQYPPLIRAEPKVPNRPKSPWWRFWNR